MHIIKAPVKIPKTPPNRVLHCFNTGNLVAAFKIFIAIKSISFVMIIKSTKEKIFIKIKLRASPPFSIAVLYAGIKNLGIFDRLSGEFFERNSIHFWSKNALTGVFERNVIRGEYSKNAVIREAKYEENPKKVFVNPLFIPIVQNTTITNKSKILMLIGIHLRFYYFKSLTAKDKCGLRIRERCNCFYIAFASREPFYLAFLVYECDLIGVRGYN